MTWPFAPLLPFSQDLLVVDPPAPFETYSAAGQGKSPQAQYECMSLQAIKALPVGDLVGVNSWCFLWATAPLLPFGIECLNAWGFDYRSYLVWEKVFASGKPAIGPGYIVRTQCEICLIGAIGSPRYRSALPSSFKGIRREHSRKPEEFYRLIDERFAPEHMRRADIFSRQARPGWTSFGNEVGKFRPTTEAA